MTKNSGILCKFAVWKYRKMYRILDKINSPADLKVLSIRELMELCGEIRDYIVKCCAVNPGHLGSSLGAVEIMVALHYVYNTPEDKLVFDVGHQAYAHKIITGRREAFAGNRTREGISGFPKRSESIYDAFGVGHSSTSISAALGMAEAAKQKGTHEKVVALIGDGSLTGGLAFEGLNNAGASKSDLLIIINDNNISIDNNTGGMHNYLLDLTTNPRYNSLKKHVWDWLGDGRFRKKIQQIVVNAKSNLVRKSGGALFESLGFRYFGPIDGNDLEQLIGTLQRLKALGGPRILHTITLKGKGYPAAEKNQTVWHAPGKFNPETGERLPVHYSASRYQDVFGQVLVELAQADSRVVGVTPAMASGCGMNKLAQVCPSRFYDVGIEEEHAVTFSAGLAASGMRPFCNIYSSFSQRAYDQIIHDVALQDLPVTLCFDRAGLVGEDGSTHHGCFDMAAYRSIPGTTIAVPADEIELKDMMYTALHSGHGPFIIRYPRGCGEGADWQNHEFGTIEPGKAKILREGRQIAVIAAGPFAYRALEAAERICAENPERTPAVYNIRYIKPLDTHLLDHILTDFEHIITIEDGCISGGLYGAVSEYVIAGDSPIPVTAIGIPDKYITQARQSDQRKECRLDTEGIYGVMTKIFEKIEKKS